MESINVDTKLLATIRNIHNFQLKNLLLKSTDMSLTPMLGGNLVLIHGILGLVSVPTIAK